MSTAGENQLLADGVSTAFADIESTVSAAGPMHHHAAQAPPRALTATVVAIGPPERLQQQAPVLEELGESGGVRAILISEGSSARPSVRVSAHSIAVIGLTPAFLDNAVAALRLSSLPTLVWWRGGSPDALERVAHLADRLVLDVDDPSDLWARVPALAEDTAVSDLRWTRLTRWRALMAHFFDAPEIAGAAFQSLEIETADRHAGRLFAGWLKSSLQWKDDVRIDLQETDGGVPLGRVRLTGAGQQLTLALRKPGGTCVEASAQAGDRPIVSRIVSLGDQSVTALVIEELRIRSRDIVFERAVAAL